MQSLKASAQGLTRIRQKREQITQEKGWTVDHPQWLCCASEFLPEVNNGKDMVSAAVSIGTWKRFLAGKAIRPNNFKAFCQVLRLNWEEVVSCDTIVGPQSGKEHKQVNFTQHSFGEGGISARKIMRSIATRRGDWGEAIDVSLFLGRTQELGTLRQWIVQDNCRLVGLFGMGGIGKTALSVKLAQQIQHEFELVIWRSLQDAPPVNDILATLIQFLSLGQVSGADLPKSTSERITILLEHLRSERCLVILDNAESIFQEGARAGQYRKGYEGYGELLKRVGVSCHRSCLLLTSCEKPQELVGHEGEIPAVRSLELTGLNESEGRAIFQAKGDFTGTPQEWKELIQHYGGNPLALKIVACATLEIFGGQISQVVKHLKTGSFPFADINQLLARQFHRLTDAEQEVIYWLAINREPISFSDLKDDILSPQFKQQLPDTLSSLKRKSLIEIRSHTLFTLQPVVMEYAINLFIAKICEEITSGEIALFNSHALLKAQANDCVRNTQIRLILEQVLDRLLYSLKGKSHVEDRLGKILSEWRIKYPHTPGYTAGNVINLLCQLKTDLSGYDFSHLTVWQAYLRGVSLRDVNFALADLAKSVFPDALGPVFSVASSLDGELLAAGGGKGEIYLKRHSSPVIPATVSGG